MKSFNHSMIPPIREQPKMSFQEPKHNKEVQDPLKVGTGRKPGSQNFDDKDPKTKPRIKPLTSGWKSQGIFRTVMKMQITSLLL